MNGLHVIRDKHTKRMRVFWPPHDPAKDEAGPSPVDLTDDEEYVFLPHMNYETVWEVARRQVADVEGIAYTSDERLIKKDIRVGYIHIDNRSVKADPPPKKPQGLLGELETLRQDAGKEDNEPLTFGDIRKVSEQKVEESEARISARRAEEDDRDPREDLPLSTSRGRGWRRATYTRIPGYVDRSNVGRAIPALQDYNAQHKPHIEKLERDRIRPADLHPLKTFVSQGLDARRTEEENDLARQIVKTFAPDQDINPEELVNSGQLPEIVAEIVRVFGPQLEDS